MFVEGLLRELRVIRVTAGRLESAIATEDFDSVVGWEMLEMSAEGHRMLPVAFQYTFTGPRSGFGQARFDRLTMAQSESVQYLMVGGPTSNRPHLHGLEPYPEDMTKGLGHHFTRKNEGAKKMQDIRRPIKAQPGRSRGAATTELFQWAARTTVLRRPQITDPRLKRAAASMVSPSFGSRKRDALDVDRDLSGFRRLALSRSNSNVMGVDSDVYKDEGYDAHEEFIDDDAGDPASQDSMFADSLDGQMRRRSDDSAHMSSRGSVARGSMRAGPRGTIDVGYKPAPRASMFGVSR